MMIFVSVLSFMLFRTEGLYIETGSCEFWFYVSVLRHWSYHLTRERERQREREREKAVNVPRGVAWWEGESNQTVNQYFKYGNFDFSHTKNLGNMKEN